MSDPVKNPEIEDVLSSIRRLVSENHGDVRRAGVETKSTAEAVNKPQSSRKDAAQVAADRLVLSPALRVEEAKDEEPKQGSTSPIADTPFAKSLKEDILPLRESLPSFLQQRLEPFDDADTGISETEDEIEEVESDIVAVDDFDEDSENTVLFPAPDELTFATARSSEALEEDVPPARNRDETPPWEIEGERLSEWHSVRADDVSDHFEPDGPEDGDNAGTRVATLNWEDHDAETEDTDAVAPAKPEISAPDPVAEQIAEAVVEEIAPSEDTIDAQQYDAVLDEEMLRELVGEIVRQELQGPLGERITRNVRKLVRREINRALTARSFNDG